MKNFNHKKGTHFSKKSKVIFFVFGLLIFSLVASAIIIRSTYQNNLQPYSNENKGVVVTIAPGSVPSEIAQQLKSKNVIKSDWAFEWYVRNHNLRSEIKAGTYVLKPSQSIPEIADQITSGKVATDLVTILPGKRLDQIEDGLVEAGFSRSEVKDALKPENYQGHPALTDKPAKSNLEGYLYPESFQKTANTTAKQIIKLSLDEMADHLTPSFRQSVSEKGLSVHQAVILASIVEQEENKNSDKPTVAQVFLKRYEIGMSLGSDVTAFYGATIAGKPKSVAYDSPFNTRIYEGLPPGPISNVSESSLMAIANPSQTDYLYFVAGDDGVTYFSKTLAEHEALTKKHCIELCK